MDKPLTAMTREELADELKLWRSEQERIQRTIERLQLDLEDAKDRAKLAFRQQVRNGEYDR